MKFIIHQSASSLDDAQSSVWANQLYGELKELGHLSAFSRINGLALPVNSDNLIPLDNQTHHIVFLTNQDCLSLLSFFKALPYPPQVIWSGLSIPKALFDPHHVMPDLMLIPEWLSSSTIEAQLSNKTLLIKTPIINNDYSDGLDTTFLDQMLYFDEQYEFLRKGLPEHLLGIQLERSFSGSCYESIENRKRFIDSLVCVIKEKEAIATTDEALHVALAAPLYSDENHEEMDKNYLIEFALELDNALKKARLTQVVIVTLPDSHGPISPTQMLEHLLVHSKSKSVLIPSNEKAFLAHSQFLCAVGVTAFSYGLAQSATSKALSDRGFIKQLTYSFEALPPLDYAHGEYFKGSDLTECLSLLCEKVVSLSLSREALVLPTPQSNTLFSSIFVLPNKAKTTKSHRLCRTVTFHSDVDEHEQKKRSCSDPKPISQWQTGWTLFGVSLASAVGVAAVSCVINDFSNNG